ncbi:MAG TPA: ATP-binding protein [Candidatus Polarisedimenticolia bacterium]|nr:ATP-binding protein [Candidatus Polarisedimenticolia bacterium]
MSDDKPANDAVGKSVGAKLGFDVAKQWPARGAARSAKDRAVQALVAGHTLIVGQSRSGKTITARRIIEEIINWTQARVVILDPNADFRFLNEVDPNLDRKIPENEFFADRWSVLGKEIEIATPDGGAWGIKWGELSKREMAAFLGLTGTDDFGEYSHFDRHYKYQEKDNGFSTLDAFKSSKYFETRPSGEDEDLERYRLRLENVAQLGVWWKIGTDKDLDSLFEGTNRAVVVDLSKDDQQVRMITAARTLEALWRQGEKRRKAFLESGTGAWPGTLVVIDEGHVFAPPAPEGPQKRLVCERIQRFADQGKKLNLYLMVVTQQPGKLHRDVLSEFNNRIILRVNERRSLKVLEETYGGFRGRYDGALTFEQGEALVEGALLCDEDPPPAAPRGVQFEKSRSKEGGGTPKPDWALPRE